MGYVTNHDGRWYAVSYEGLDPLTGRDRRRWHRATDHADAQAIADTLPSARPPSSRGVTVSRYLRTRWLPTREARLRPTTSFRDEQMIDRYVLSHIGRVPLRSLTITHLEDLYTHLRRSGSHDGGPLAPKTVLNVHQILRTELGDAKRAGLVHRNVARLMNPPCHGAAPEQRCWNEHELRRFLQVAMTNRLGPAIWLAAMTGMRCGEVLGLRRSDIDLDASTLSVRRSVSCTGYEVHTTATKTRTSRRAVDLDESTVEVLREWKRHQHRAQDGHAPTRLFTRPDGRPVHPHALSQTFNRLRSAGGVPTIRLHDLRHTHATLMLKHGVPLKVVSERLGHSTPAFTMAVYQHVLPGMQRHAADTFARRAGGRARAQMTHCRERRGRPRRRCPRLVSSRPTIGFISAIDLVTTDAARAGDPWDVALIAAAADPARVEQVLADLPGVDRWFADLDRRSTYHDGAFLSVATGGDPGAAGYQIADGRPLQSPGEAIVGYGFMKRFDVTVGDRIEFLAGTTPINVEIVGWYRDTEESGEILRYRFEDLTAAEPEAIPEVYRVSLTPGSDPAAVGTALAERVGPEARSEVLDTGRSDIEPLMTVLRAVAAVLFLTAGTNLLSTLITSSRESARRTGVELAIGFTPRQLIGQGAVAGAVLGLVATMIGVPVGLAVFRILADAVSSGIGVGPGWMPTPSVASISIIAGIAIMLSVALGAVAVRRIATRPAADLVRGE